MYQLLLTIVKISHYRFPEPNIISSNVLLSLTNNLELKDIQFTIIIKQTKVVNLHVGSTVTREWLTFLLINDLNNLLIIRCVGY